MGRIDHPEYYKAGGIETVDWKPKYGECYFMPNPFNKKCYMRRKWEDKPCDETAYVRGVVCKTWKEARDMCVKMTESARKERRK